VADASLRYTRAMLRDFWNKLVGKDPASVERREAELEEMSPDERQFATQSVDDIAANSLANERLGAYGSQAMLGENDERPPFS
jgi:hypothetical protein